jgi:hypothetical protein
MDLDEYQRAAEATDVRPEPRDDPAFPHKHDSTTLRELADAIESTAGTQWEHTLIDLLRRAAKEKSPP